MVLSIKGYPDTKDAIYNKYSKRAVLSYYDWGDEGIDDDTNGIELNGLFNPYELEGDNIYVLINKDDPKLKFQIAINKKDYTLADIDDNEIYDLDVLLEEYPELEDFFVNELNILTRWGVGKYKGKHHYIILNSVLITKNKNYLLIPPIP